MNITTIKEQSLSIAKKHEITDMVKRISDIKTEDIQINVAFLGEFNSGKSTLINALLGKKILPTFVEPTTAAITEISRSDKDRFFVIKSDEEGNEVTQEISIGDLAQEITKVDINKKVIVQLKGLDFLDDNLLVVDTPGVSSIEETHDDVTFGYLPLVDVAFILMDINIGAPSKSLFDFLKQYPKEMLSKIYFVLNFIDTVDTDKIEKRKISFYETLHSIIENPRIIPVSAQKALDVKLGRNQGEAELTGFNEIKSIIKEEIPQLKVEIANKRVSALYKSELKKLIELLETKSKSLNWNPDEFDANIKKLTSEIEDIEKDLRDFNEKFRSIKKDCLMQIQSVVNDYAKTISVQIAKEKPIDDIVHSMLEDVNQILENYLKQIENYRLTSLNTDISQIIKSSLENEVSQIKEIADLITDIATFVATVWLVPGGSEAGKAATEGGKATITVTEAASGAGITAAQKTSRMAQAAGKIGAKGKELAEVLDNPGEDAEEDEKTGTKEKMLKTLGAIGKVIKGVNPLEKVKTISLPYVINPKLRKKLGSMISSKLELVFSAFEQALNEEIQNNYLIPLKEKEELIEKTCRERDKKIEHLDSLRKSIKEDIESVTKLV